MSLEKLKEIYKDAENRMDGAVKATHDELVKIRSGKASTTILNGILIDYYGTKTPLNQVATISAPEPRLLTIQPWDKSVIQTIEKEIMQSELGLNPENDGTIIRIPIPQLTEERRKDLVKLAKKFTEEGHIAIRNVRRDANQHIKKLQTNHEISEDNAYDGLDQIQKITDNHIKKIDDHFALKEKEIMEV